MADILDRLDEMNESGVIAYDIYNELHDLASQLEKRKVGKWVELPKAFNQNENPCQCSLCKEILSFMNGYPKSKYCPNCGADMRGNENVSS